MTRVPVLQALVAKQAERRPERPAVGLGGDVLTYGSLEARSNQLARVLLDGGCQPGDRVGVLVPKSPMAVVGIVGVLKASCVYVPIDPDSPASRVKRILDSAECRYVLAAGGARALLSEPGGDCGLIWLDKDGAPDGALTPRYRLCDVQAQSTAAVDWVTRGDDPAHILFTSGSTGMPKGVVVGHANVINFVEWACGYFGLNETDRTSGHSPLHFDLSTFDLFGTFAAGAYLSLTPRQVNIFPQKLPAFIVEQRLTQWFSVPSALAYVAKFDALSGQILHDLKRLIWCGEVFPINALQYWMKRLPDAAFTNLYGPTEATIASSYFTVPRIPETGDEVPIGAPCAGEKLLVMDEQMKPTSVGETGELYIGGIGVTHGYWRDEENTAAVFLEHGGERLYKTGDLGIMGEDGLVRFVGRADSQIKSRGHRIELGEIEVALDQVDEVGEGVIAAVAGTDFEGARICCAFVSKPGVEATPIVVKQRLGTLLPRYMVPTRLTAFEQLPRNANGKIDRVAIREHFEREEANRGRLTTPRRSAAVS